MTVSVLGAGAFGTALAIALAQTGQEVVLWGRDVAALSDTRENARRLPGIKLPTSVRVTDTVTQALSDTILIALPAQKIRAFAQDHSADLSGRSLIACCKGIDTERLIGPAQILRDAVPDSTVAILTGPSFAADIARGLPTALTLACRDRDHGRKLQAQLSTPTLRLYLSTDTAGAELGGAMKNVIAIACGAVMGAGWGDSARSALMARGFAEMQRIAPYLGAHQDTLCGLSGLGDLALTCGTDLSRNYRFGYALGQGDTPHINATVEGVTTAQAIMSLGAQHNLDLPICDIVAGLATQKITVDQALEAFMARPLRDE